MLSKIKKFVKENFQDIFIISTIVLVALAAFGIGRLSVPDKNPILIKGMERANVEELMPAEQVASASTNVGTTTSQEGAVVGSKNSDKYHLPSCPGAKQISEENKIWFNSIEDAERAGYKPAGNCPGLAK